MKRPIYAKAEDKLHNMGHCIRVDISEDKRIQYDHYVINGHLIILQSWLELDGFEIYVPVCSDNNIDETFKALEQYNFKGAI